MRLHLVVFSAICVFCAARLSRAECADVRGVFQTATIDGQKITDGDAADLTGIELRQNGCVLTGSFFDRHCGISHQLSITLDQGHDNGSLTITRTSSRKSVVMRGTAIVTKQSLSWTITSIEPPTKLENGISDPPFTETRTFVEGFVVRGCLE